MRSFIFSLFFCLACIAPQAFGASYSLQTNPTHPQPNEPYTVTLSSIDGNASSISWFINGSEYVEGSNTTQIELPPTQQGQRTNIVARITSPAGVATEVRTDVYPVRVDLHISADTYTPAFYTGRPLPSSGSTITASALVFDGDRNMTNAYSYRWRLNGKALQGGLSLSQNSLSFTPSFEDELTLQVDVIGQGGTVVAQQTQRIPVIEPELHFYEKNPLRGLSLISLPDPFTLIAEETVIAGEPYYMDTNAEQGDLHMEWELNGKPALSGDARNEISLQRNGNSGKAFVSFHVRNLTQLLQGVQRSFTVQF